MGAFLALFTEGVLPDNFLEEIFSVDELLEDWAD